jgi:hypothetical protein
MTPEIAGRISGCNAAKSRAQYGGLQVQKQATYFVLPASTRSRLRPGKHGDPPTISLHQKSLAGSPAAMRLRAGLNTVVSRCRSKLHTLCSQRRHAVDCDLANTGILQQFHYTRNRWPDLLLQCR